MFGDTHGAGAEKGRGRRLISRSHTLTLAREGVATRGYLGSITEEVGSADKVMGLKPRPPTCLITFLAFSATNRLPADVLLALKTFQTFAPELSYALAIYLQRDLRPRNHLLADFHFRSTCLAEKPELSPSPSKTPSYKVYVRFQTWEYHVFSCWDRLAASEVKEEAFVAVEESSGSWSSDAI